MCLAALVFSLVALVCAIGVFAAVNIDKGE